MSDIKLEALKLELHAGFHEQVMEFIDARKLLRPPIFKVFEVCRFIEGRTGNNLNQALLKDAVDKSILYLEWTGRLQRLGKNEGKISYKIK